MNIFLRVSCWGGGGRQWMPSSEYYIWSPNIISLTRKMNNCKPLISEYIIEDMATFGVKPKSLFGFVERQSGTLTLYKAI